jgi:hypothetical protein
MTDPWYARSAGTNRAIREQVGAARAARADRRIPEMTALRSIRTYALCLATFAGLGLALAPTVSHAELAKWDQDRVTGIAEKLADAANDVYRSVVRKQTGAQVGSGQANSFLRLKDKTRLARNETRHLAKQVQDGKGRDETFPIYQRLMTLVRDIRSDARRMYLEAPTLDKIAAAGDLLRQIAPYYDAKANENPNVTDPE